MTQFEYRKDLVTVTYPGDQSDIQLLDALGMDGWELCHAEYCSNGQIILYMKRALTPKRTP